MRKINETFMIKSYELNDLRQVKRYGDDTDLIVEFEAESVDESFSHEFGVNLSSSIVVLDNSIRVFLPSSGFDEWCVVQLSCDDLDFLTRECQSFVDKRYYCDDYE